MWVGVAHFVHNITCCIWSVGWALYVCLKSGHLYIDFLLLSFNALSRTPSSVDSAHLSLLATLSTHRPRLLAPAISTAVWRCHTVCKRAMIRRYRVCGSLHARLVACSLTSFACLAFSRHKTDENAGIAASFVFFYSSTILTPQYYRTL